MPIKPSLEAAVCVFVPLIAFVDFQIDIFDRFENRRLLWKILDGGGVRGDDRVQGGQRLVFATPVWFYVSEMYINVLSDYN